MSQNLPDPSSEEPLVSVGTITAAATAALALLVAFAVPVTDGQQAAILGVVAVVAPIVVMAIGRSKVYSPASVARKVRAAQAGRQT